MRTVFAGLFVVALTGCPEGVFAAFDGSGVCEADGTLCYDATDGGKSDKRHCDEETSEYVEGVTCADLGYAELCKDDEDTDTVIYGIDPEACDAFDNNTL